MSRVFLAGPSDGELSPCLFRFEAVLDLENQVTLFCFSLCLFVNTNHVVIVADRDFLRFSLLIQTF